MGIQPLKTALVLGGGGARGIAHAGVLRVLLDEGLSPDIIVGTSAGAIIGAAFALGGDIEATDKKVIQALTSSSFSKLERRFGQSTNTEPAGWRDRLEYAVTQIQRLVLHHRRVVRSSLLRNSFLRELIDHLVGNQQFADLKLPFFAVAYDLRAQENVILGAGDLAIALWASSAIPGVFEPVPVGDMVLVDGCVLQTVPVAAAWALGANFVVAVDIGSPPLPADIPASAAGVAARASELRANRLRELNLADANVVIRPDVGDIHWTEVSRAEDARRAGVSATRAALNKITRAKNAAKWRSLGKRVFRSSPPLEIRSVHK